MRPIAYLFALLLLGLVHQQAYAQEEPTLTATPEGNVGIGTTTPEQRLDVNAGSVRITNEGETNALVNRPIIFLNQVRDENIEDFAGGLIWQKNGAPRFEMFYNNAGNELVFWNPDFGAMAAIQRDGGRTLRLGETVFPNDNYIWLATGGGNAYRSGLQMKVFGEEYGFTIEHDDRVESLGLNILRHDNNVEGESALFIHRNTGNVGIGTTFPEAPMHIISNGSPFPAENGLYVYNPVNEPGQHAIGSLRVAGDGGGDPFLSLDVNGEAGWSVGMDNDDANKFKVAQSWDNLDAGTRLTIDLDGNVGLGTTQPAHPLEMASGAHVTEGGVWTDASSRQLKENIGDLTAEEALAALLALNPVRYNYRAEQDEEYLGFIAEDVPDLVAMNERRSLSPMDIVAVLTKVVQQQQQEIEALKAQLQTGQ